MARTKMKESRKRGSGHKPRVTNPDDDKRDDLLQKSDMKNQKFEAYYEKQLAIPSDEWCKFLDTCREPLPSTFRIAGSRETAAVLTSVVQDTYIPHLTGVVFEDQPIPPPMALPWYPNGLAWQFNVPKKALRRSPEFKKFHAFLVFETEVGNITRQEAVSMLPPLFLDVEPHHFVLDMCAAPGSKTSQLLESLHSSQSLLESCVPPGLLIANDSDYKRTHLLIHQTARLPSPAFMVTNVDASIFPSLYLPPESVADSSERKTRPSSLLFDRILCDVPCSGDGTIRKNVGIWKKWNAYGWQWLACACFHLGSRFMGKPNCSSRLQLRILQRAMRMLRRGGKIVYSTCSLNPVENEAVVAEALRTVPGFELVDSRPTILRDILNTTSPRFLMEKAQRVSVGVIGLQQKNLAWLGGHVYSSSGTREGKRTAEEVAEVYDVKKARLEGDEDVLMASATTELPMSKPTDSEPSFTSTVRTRSATKEVQKEKQQDSGTGEYVFKEMPYTFVSPGDPIVENCKQVPSLWDFPSSNLLVRNPAGEPTRSLYLTNDIGTKIFMRQESGFGRRDGGDGEDGAERVPRFRVLSEGLPVVLPYIKPETILDADVPALRVLLETYYPLLSSFGEAFRRDVGGRPQGSHVVRFRAGGTVDGASDVHRRLTHDLVLPVWRSTSSVSLMIDKKAKSALSLRVFGEDFTVAGRQARSGMDDAREPDVPETETETEGAEGVKAGTV
ncbi:S-adenosyl-L-methionine-dependent methyltransferase [Russula earlei]|uniref:S-adenosyl-L-methionine-dependent methyltransferase n=1 Tax=Russula earlei TaxID=71964 RepID=A0ACC0UKS3_9AGAM|nr:S-adenosyl-L-methionine-dependent methyltransferase [Russula earlei]